MRVQCAVAPGWADVGGGHVGLNLEGHGRKHGRSSVSNGGTVTCFEQGGDMIDL